MDSNAIDVQVVSSIQGWIIRRNPPEALANNRRLLGPIGDIPPVEFEAAYYEQQNGQAMAA